MGKALSINRSRDEYVWEGKLCKPLDPKILTLTVSSTDKWNDRWLMVEHGNAVRFLTWKPNDSSRLGSCLGCFTDYCKNGGDSLFHPTNPSADALVEIDAATMLGTGGQVWTELERWKTSYYLTATALIFGKDDFSECTVFRGYGAFPIKRMWFVQSGEHNRFQYLEWGDKNIVCGISDLLRVLCDILTGLMYLHQKRCVLGIRLLQYHDYMFVMPYERVVCGVIGGFSRFVPPNHHQNELQDSQWPDCIGVQRDVELVLQECFKGVWPRFRQLDAVVGMLQRSIKEICNTSLEAARGGLHNAQQMLTKICREQPTPAVAIAGQEIAPCPAAAPVAAAASESPSPEAQNWASRARERMKARMLSAAQPAPAAEGVRECSSAQRQQRTMEPPSAAQPVPAAEDVRQRASARGYRIIKRPRSAAQPAPADACADERARPREAPADRTARPCGERTQ